MNSLRWLLLCASLSVFGCGSGQEESTSNRETQVGESREDVGEHGDRDADVHHEHGDDDAAADREHADREGHDESEGHDADVDDGQAGGTDEAPPVPEAPEFMRFEETGEHSGRLETAVATYENADGVQIDLIAVVHIGDQAYYDDLDERFKSYDAVLYEMIAPEGADPSQRGGGSPVSMIQTMLCRGLGLAFQLDAIDYGADNFVHADLTTEGFAKVWEERNMNFFKLLMQLMSASMGAEPSKLTPAAMFEAVRSKNRKQQLKFLLGQEFSNLEAMFAGSRNESGEDTGILIGARNEAALVIVEREIKAGKKRMCLFYGAGHMMDFDVRLARDHGFRRVRSEWLIAWDVSAQK